MGITKLFDEQNVELTIDELKVKKIKSLSNQCNSFILKGFNSLCRGISTSEFFSCSEYDQKNVMGYVSMINAGMTEGIIWKSAEESLCTPFTPMQMMILAGDMMKHIKSNIYQFEILREIVKSATTIAEINVVVWEGVVI